MNFQFSKESKSTLQFTNFVILELRLAGKECNYRPSEIICFMKDNGFGMVTILSEGRRREAINYLDILFVKENILDDIGLPKN